MFLVFDIRIVKIQYFNIKARRNKIKLSVTEILL